MKICFDVHIQPQALDAVSYGTDTYQGYVTFDKVVIFTTAVTDPHGPGALREMKHDVARQFAEHLVKQWK